MADWTKTLRLNDMDPYSEDDFLFGWGGYLDGANIVDKEVSAVNAVIESSLIVNGAQAVTCRVKTAELDSDVTLSCKITTDDIPPRKEKRSVTIGAASL